MEVVKIFNHVEIELKNVLCLLTQTMDVFNLKKGDQDDSSKG